MITYYVGSKSTFDGILPESTVKVNLHGKEVPYWSGKSILSYIIPNNINLVMTNDSYDTLNEDTPIKDQMNKVIIENGEIIEILVKDGEQVEYDQILFKLKEE